MYFESLIASAIIIEVNPLNDFMEYEKMISVVTSIVAMAGMLTLIYTLTKDFVLKKPRLIFKVDNAKLIEDFIGELGMQIDVEIKAYNSPFFLKNIELKNANKDVNQKSEIKVDVREYVKEDIIQKYLDRQRQGTTSEEKEKQKLDEFLYYANSGSEQDYKVDDLGNPKIPDITSDFQKTFPYLIQSQLYEDNRYKLIARNISSLYNFRIDNQSIYSFSLFFHVYGRFDTSLQERTYLPLKDWYIVLKHSEGKIEKKLKLKIVSYAQLKSFIDEEK